MNTPLSPSEQTSVHSLVRDYYGKQLRASSDLKTTACCDTESVPQWLAGPLANIHPDVQARYYGCGLVCPPLLQACRVLDLGCGAGRDVYLLAQLVGPEGEVVGVDMTEEQLALAERLRAWHAQRFGYANVRFLHGFIERLDALGLEANSFDVVVSNCVLNLSPDKEAVLSAVWQLLKPGGEFYFSDVYTDRRLPRELQSDPVLYGECLAGALYENDFLRMARAAAFTDPRLVRQRAIDICNAELAARVTGVRFRSATYRLFKLEGLEDACEDYGQAVIYRGSIPEYPDCFPLDAHHEFERGRVTPVCGNTWRMLSQTRLAPHFECIGNFARHYGAFRACSLPSSETSRRGNDVASCC